MKIKNIEDLDAWKEAILFCEMIYKLANKLPIKHLRASARGVAANIAERFGRYFYKENLRFYGIAKGCLNEVKSDLNICLRIEYITQENLMSIFFKQIRLNQY